MPSGGESVRLHSFSIIVVRLDVVTITESTAYVVSGPTLLYSETPLVTEQSMYTVRSCRLPFSRTKSLTSESDLPAGHS